MAQLVEHLLQIQRRDDVPIKSGGDDVPIESGGDDVPVKSGGDDVPIKSGGEFCSVQFSSVQFKMVSMRSGRPINYVLHPVSQEFPQCCP